MDNKQQENNKEKEEKQKQLLKEEQIQLQKKKKEEKEQQEQQEQIEKQDQQEGLVNHTNINNNGTSSTYQPNLLNHSKYSKTNGIYPIILNPNKVLSILKQNIEVTPENSFNKLGEFVNQYKNKSTNTKKIFNKNKKYIKLNNNYRTIIDTIRLFANDNANLISPNAFINIINNIKEHYNDTDKKNILIHFSYLAETIYQHFSKMISSLPVDRDDFFSDENGLDNNAVLECAEFYYTDIYLLNTNEQKELINTLNTYYLQ